MFITHLDIHKESHFEESLRMNLPLAGTYILVYRLVYMSMPLALIAENSIWVS